MDERLSLTARLLALSARCQQESRELEDSFVLGYRRLFLPPFFLKCRHVTYRCNDRSLCVVPSNTSIIVTLFPGPFGWRPPLQSSGLGPERQMRWELTYPTKWRAFLKRSG